MLLDLKFLEQKLKKLIPNPENVGFFVVMLSVQIIKKQMCM